MQRHSVQILKPQVGWYSLVCVNSLCCSMTKLDPNCNAYYMGTSFLELCVNSRWSTTTLQEGGIMWRVISCGIRHHCWDVCYMGTLLLAVSCRSLHSHMHTFLAFHMSTVSCPMASRLQFMLHGDAVAGGSLCCRMAHCCDAYYIHGDGVLGRFM